MQETIEKTKNFVLEKYSHYNGKFGSKFIKLATIKSIALAKKLSKTLNLNQEALLIGIYLHDIGRIITDEEDHTIEGKKIAEVFLQENKIENKVTREIIFDCILNHGSKANPTTDEGKLLQFIDKAVLIDPEIIITYIEHLSSQNDKKQAKEIALKKLTKWYESLYERKSEFGNSYKQCIKAIDDA